MKFKLFNYEISINKVGSTIMENPIMLDKFEPLNPIVRDAMLDIAKIKVGDRHIDLGSGNGQFVVEATKRGAISMGYEIDKTLADQSIAEYGINVINDDCFNADVSEADVITCWFSKLPETQLLMDKLYREMKVGARLVKCAYTPSQWKPVQLPSIPAKFTRENFQTENIFRVNGEIVCLYIKQ